MQVSHLHYRYSCRHGLFQTLQFALQLTFVADWNALLPSRINTKSVASVIYLSPDHLRCITTRPVSYYALFKWWLLLSQHPGCLSNYTSFFTKYIFGDLSRRSGLFPSRVRSLSPARCLPQINLWHSEFGWVQ